MNILETIKDLAEARELLTQLQADPQSLCEEYGVDIDDMNIIESELEGRINAIESNDIKWFCEYKLAIYNNSKMRSEWIKKEIERLSNLVEYEEKQQEKAKNSINWILLSTNTDKLETEFNNLSFRKSEAVSIIDEASIPAEYWNIKEVKTIDKVWIKEAIKSGKEVAGASIETRQNLQIK